MAPKRSVKQQDGKKGNSDRVIAITAVDHHSGSALAELLLSDDSFKGGFKQVVGITFGDPIPDAKEIIDEYGLQTLSYEELDENKLKELGVDTLCLIPPARKDKLKITRNILEVGKKAKNVTNVVLLSSAGCDYAEKDKQPHLREFIELEVLAMQPKSDPSTEQTGHSPCIVRAGFYLENLLLYSKQAQGEGKLPIPIDEDHKFAPVALGDVALLLAKILTSHGEHGLSDDVRGQMIVLTGPQMTAGPELAEAASQALGTKLEFRSIRESEAKKILSSGQGDELDESEMGFLLEYYSLVREGKTNYVAGRPTFQKVTGQDLTLPTDFFDAQKDSFSRKKRRTSKKEKDEE